MNIIEQTAKANYRDYSAFVRYCKQNGIDMDSMEEYDMWDSEQSDAMLGEDEDDDWAVED